MEDQTSNSHHSQLSFVDAKALMSQPLSLHSNPVTSPNEIDNAEYWLPEEDVNDASNTFQQLDLNAAAATAKPT